MNSGELLNQLLIDLQSLFRTSFRKKKFTLSQISLISSIPTNGIEMTSISSYLGIDNSTLTRNVNVLIKQDILKRDVNPKDRRSKLLVLTSHGVNVKLELEKTIEKIGNKIFKNKVIVDSNQFIDMLDALHWEINKLKLK
jgi:DNA-binding MarR family transcriptional regulator